MKHIELQWKSDDGVPLLVRKWEPDHKPKGVVCLVHGLGEHSGRYAHWAERLTGAGYAVFSCDQRGHGRSGGQRGHVPSFDHLGDDLDLVLAEANKNYPKKPCFLYGQSLGGIFVLFYLIQRRPQLTGAVITSPGLHNSLERQKVKVMMARILGLIIPKLSMASGLNEKALSRDPGVIAAYLHDPLVHDRVTVHMAREMLGGIEYVFNRAAEISLPLLLMHGSGDRIAYNSGAEKIVSLVSGDCTYKLWEGLYHELHNEPEKDEVFDFLKEWLDSRALPRPGT